MNDGWKLSIPRPLQIVIDDVGWRSGEDGRARGEPARTGIGRDHVAADYEAVAYLGRRLGMRPVAALVLAEWDRENLLRELPSSTWMGASWDNRGRVGPWLDEAADVLARNRGHLEIALHGLAHEYWEAGRPSRSEFHDDDGVMRPRAEVVRHLEYFGRLLEQHGLGPFPETYVPPAMRHAFGNGEAGMQPILRDFGVRFVTTRFDSRRRRTPPRHPWITSEQGVTLVRRGALPVEWNALDPEPRCGFDEPTLALHWPNVLHPDPRRNREVVDRWVDFLRPYGDRLDGMLAPDTRGCWTQLAFHALARVTPRADGFEIDLSRVADVVTPAFADRFTVKIKARRPPRWSVEGGGPPEVETDARTGYHVLRIRLPPALPSRIRIHASQPRSGRSL